MRHSITPLIRLIRTICFPSTFFLNFLFISFLASGVDAARIAVDDNSPLIVYSGNWHRTTEVDELARGGYNHYSIGDPNATATFKFRGTSALHPFWSTNQILLAGDYVEVWSPMWPYDVSAFISLDGAPPQHVDFQDYGAVPTEGGPPSQASAVRVIAQGLDPNVEHTLVFSTADGEGFLALDYIECVSAFSVVVFGNKGLTA